MDGLSLFPGDGWGRTRRRKKQAEVEAEEKAGRGERLYLRPKERGCVPSR